jgi:outer membrane lipoprotein-sorting protein
MILGFLILPVSLSIAQQTPTATVSPQRDTQALSILAQMLNATGWGSAALPVDAGASGTVTRYMPDGQSTVEVTIQSKGTRLYRAVVQDPTGPFTTIVNGDGGTVSTPSGTRSLPVHAAISQRVWVFPVFSDLLALSDGAVGLQYVGMENVNGQSAHRIEIQRQYTRDDALGGLRTQLSHLTVWISPTNWYPVQVQFNRASDDNPTAIRALIRTLSDFRFVNGLAFPFRQEQIASGQLMYTLQLNTVVFNAGLSDTLFALPLAQN